VQLPAATQPGSCILRLAVDAGAEPRELMPKADGVITTTCDSWWCLCAVGVLQVIAIVSRADGSRAASIGTDGCLRLWETATGSCLSNKVRQLARHTLQDAVAGVVCLFQTDHCYISSIQIAKECMPSTKKSLSLLDSPHSFGRNGLADVVRRNAVKWPVQPASFDDTRPGVRRRGAVQ
jgi:hypothetical protein